MSRLLNPGRPHAKDFKYTDPNDAASMTQWARDFIDNNPHATLLDYEKIMSDHGRRSGRSQYYQACREYRDKYGLGKLPRGGDRKPKPANHGQRLPTRKKVEAVAVKKEPVPTNGKPSITPYADAIKRKPIVGEATESVMKLLVWMQKYGVRVLTVECESQEVTLSNEPRVKRQMTPSPHFTVQDD